MLRKLFGVAAALLALGGVALAQVNTVPQVGVNTANIRAQTYVANSVGLAPGAGATDVFCISGSQSKNIHVREVNVSGLATTLYTTPFIWLRRVALDNTGTAVTTGNAFPVAASLRTTNGAATATLYAWTASPSISDANPLFIKSQMMTTPTAAAGTGIYPISWLFGTGIDMYDQGADIPSGSTAQEYCLNLNGQTLSGGSLDIQIEWTED